MTAGLHLGHHLRPVLVLLASTIATEVYTMLDTVMLEYFHGEIYVGYYSNAVKIVRMTYTVVIALVAVFYPRISMYYKQNRQEECNALLGKGTQILLLLALPCALGLFLTAGAIVPLLFGEAFFPGSRNAAHFERSGAGVFYCRFPGSHYSDGDRDGADDPACNSGGSIDQYGVEFSADSRVEAGWSGDRIGAVGGDGDGDPAVVCEKVLPAFHQRKVCGKHIAGACGDGSSGRAAAREVRRRRVDGASGDRGCGSGVFWRSASDPQ